MNCKSILKMWQYKYKGKIRKFETRLIYYYVTANLGWFCLILSVYFWLLRWSGCLCCALPLVKIAFFEVILHFQKNWVFFHLKKNEVVFHLQKDEVIFHCQKNEVVFDFQKQIEVAFLFQNKSGCLPFKINQVVSHLKKI